MSVSFTQGYAIGTAFSMDHARILWKSWDAVASASGALASRPASRVLVPDTSTWWASTVGDTSRWIILDFGSTPRPIDALGLAGHNLGGKTVLIEGATNDALSTWVTLATLEPADDSTILALFAKASYYGLRITVTVVDTAVATKISVAYVGEALVMPVRGYISLGPIDLGMDVGVNTYRTESGQIAGRFTEYTGLKGTLVFNHLREAWVRSTLVPFLKSAILLPFFVANRPEGYPTDCSYAWTTDNVIPQRMGVKDYMMIQMSVNAHAPTSQF